jgi:hypothetical protein
MDTVARDTTPVSQRGHLAPEQISSTPARLINDAVTSGKTHLHFTNIWQYSALARVVSISAANSKIYRVRTAKSIEMDKSGQVKKRVFLVCASLQRLAW